MTCDASLTNLSGRMRIADGVTMPRLGFGTYKAADGDEARQAVRTALELGYRGVDTASMYGNEASVGAAIRESGVAREDVFVSTKLWNDEQGYDNTRAALVHSLGRLDLDYVDLYLVHWPVAEHMASTWRAMERLLADGLVRAIGVCNFLPHHLQMLAETAVVPPALDQIEYHPWLQQPEVIEYCRAAGIVVQAWAPVMRGHAADEPVLVKIGNRYGKTASQVALRWILQDGHAALPKSVHPDRIAENAAVFDFTLTDAEMAEIASVDRGEAGRMGPHPDRFAF